MSEESDIGERLQRRLQRERSARAEAERLLEEKSAELYKVNQELEKLLASQGETLESYRQSMIRLTDVLLGLGEDQEVNLTRILGEGGRLLGASGGGVVKVDDPDGELVRTTQLAGGRSIDDAVWRRAVSADGIRIWEEEERRFLFIPLEIRLRRVGAIVLELDEGKEFDELGTMVAEFIGSGVAGEMERWEVKGEMKLKEERYESLFHASVDAILIVDHEGGVRDASESAQTMFGLNRSAMLRATVDGLVSEGSRARVRDEFRLVKEAGRCHFEADLLRSDGSAFPTEVVGSSLEIGGESQVYMIVRDVTQRRKGQAAVRERERKFRTVFEQSLDGIVLHEAGGKILDVNETLCKLLGWKREELTARDLMELHPERELPACRLAMEEVEQKGRHRFECKFKRKDGSTFMAEVWANSFELGGSRLVQGIVRDVTVLRQRENEIREAMEEAERANEAKSVFLATMSHEIRTPLNGIIGFADLLEDSGLKDAERNSVEMIRKSGDVLLGLINNILDFSRAESGRIFLREERFDPRKFLKDTVALHRGVADGKGLGLGVEIDEEVPKEISGSKAELRQVMMNLIGNAVKFTNEGQVDVLLERAGSGRLRFCVTDSGIGFPDEDGEKLFDAFFQVDLSSTRQHGGTGLGLAICRRLVEEMGGEIRAENVASGGARFLVELPVGEAEGSGVVAATDSGGRRHEALDGEGRKVLVVEDHPVNSRLLKMMLEKRGFVVEVAEDGGAALERLRTMEEIALIMMDMRMPVMDGLEATRRIRAGEAGQGVQGVPVVAVTANAMEADRDACREVGMGHYLSKPISGRALDEVLDEIIGAGQASEI